MNQVLQYFFNITMCMVSMVYFYEILRNIVMQNFHQTVFIEKLEC